MRWNFYVIYMYIKKCLRSNLQIYIISTGNMKTVFTLLYQSTLVYLYNMGYLPIIIWEDAILKTLKRLNYLQNRVHICLDKIYQVGSTKKKKL